MRCHFDAVKPVVGAVLAVLACGAAAQAQSRGSAFLDTGESCSLQPNGLGICMRDSCSCPTPP